MGGAQAAGRGFPSPQAPGTKARLSLSPSRGKQRPLDPLQVSPGPLGPGAAACTRREEGVGGRGHPQNPPWIPAGRSWTGAQSCPT